MVLAVKSWKGFESEREWSVQERQLNSPQANNMMLFLFFPRHNSTTNHNPSYGKTSGHMKNCQVCGEAGAYSQPRAAEVKCVSSSTNCSALAVPCLAFVRLFLAMYARRHVLLPPF
jgi:hypothetical protein